MPGLKGTAKKERETTVNEVGRLRGEVRKKFKELFVLTEVKGKNQFNREKFKNELKTQGLDYIDKNIEIIKDIESYDPKFQKGITKLFEDNEGSLTKVLKYKQTQKDFTNSLENYFNEKTNENKKDLFKSELKMSEEDINNLFRTEGAGMVEPGMVEPPPKEKIKLKAPPIKSPVTKPESPATPPLVPIPEEEEEESKEEMKQEEAKPQEPPTMSPDEIEVLEEEVKQEKLSEQKKDMPTTKRQPRTNITTFKSKMESIPESRLGTQGKEVNELVDDIEFFLKEFPSQLKSEKTIFNKVDKNNKNDLIKLHTKIATKLKPNISFSSSSSNKKVGIVINAESYIKEQMKKLLEEGVFSNLKPSDIVVDVGGTKKQDNEGTKDIGNFEVKESPDGGLSSRREGIYRYLPSENEQPNEGKKKKNNQLKIPKSQERNRATNAISMNKQNPFKRPQKTLKLKYLY